MTTSINSAPHDIGTVSKAKRSHHTQLQNLTRFPRLIIDLEPSLMEALQKKQTEMMNVGMDISLGKLAEALLLRVCNE